MSDLFLKIDFTDISTTLLKAVVLNVIGILIIWVSNLISMKLKSDTYFKLKTRIRLGNCIGSSVLLLFVSMYFSALYILNGAHAFHWEAFPWDTSNFYFKASPQLSLLALSIVLFSQNYSALSKELTKLKN
jgi:hypothetical protein